MVVAFFLLHIAIAFLVPIMVMMIVVDDIINFLTGYKK
jgi:hypothetical protein|tara:strand:+ start:987 stop:1100 length:114 start_codon:yes stop_codon:yes gene_type:complete